MRATVDPNAVEAATPEQSSAGIYKALPSHTPGPWFQDEAGICGDGDVVALIAMPDDYLGWDADDLPWHIQERLAANARLIAAAPKLLAALQQLVGVITSPEMYGVWGEMMDRLEAYNGPRFQLHVAQEALAAALPADGASRHDEDEAK